MSWAIWITGASGRETSMVARAAAARLSEAAAPVVLLELVVEPDRPIAEAARLLIDHKISALPVVEGNRLVGIVTESDFVRTLADAEAAV